MYFNGFGLIMLLLYKNLLKIWLNINNVYDFLLLKEKIYINLLYQLGGKTMKNNRSNTQARYKAHDFRNC